ncbi:hypothetical protein ACFO1B_30930 [Dactylosporangium siamense]|uniref:hypothetical protein n=1 Tax=Dactylosporangium siamense TaxID=685454 RepID=UPI0019404628|nr:hypothetical protein [Dactylosporangium siamense]
MENAEPSSAARNVVADLASMRTAYLEIEAAIRENPDAEAAFGLATQLRELIDELVGEAATFRALMADRVFRSEDMSLAELARRLKISKARADQLVRAAKAAVAEKS